jgi:arylsulfatase A-like enzyme
MQKTVKTTPVGYAILLVVSSSLVAGCSMPSVGIPDLPNIILVMADDQGWGDMAYNGHPVLKTPHFDAAAAEGLRFDRFYAAAPVCSPTRGAVMTGRHPNRFGCFSWGHTLRPQEQTIAEALHAAGYTTGHFGKWHLGPARLGTPTNPGASGFDYWISAPNFFDNDPILSRQGWAEPLKGESSMITVEESITFMREQVRASRPFFAVVWFGSPHNPHVALPEDSLQYITQSAESRAFLGEITAMDRAFGRLREAIDEMGIGDHTVLWYTSDNGGLPELGATGGRGHKGQVYEGGLRVPAFLIWPPAIKEPAITDIPAVSQDIYPTLLSIAGVTERAEVPLDGIDLQPLIQGSMGARSQPIGFWNFRKPGIRTPSAQLMGDLLAAQTEGNTTGDPADLRVDSWIQPSDYAEDDRTGHAAWLDWPWKLHRIQDADGGARLELYNLETDSMEARNCVSDYPDRTQDMLDELERWQASVIQSLNGNDY